MLGCIVSRYRTKLGMRPNRLCYRFDDTLTDGEQKLA
jgi:hypothetical protein